MFGTQSGAWRREPSCFLGGRRHSEGSGRSEKKGWYARLCKLTLHLPNQLLTWFS